MAKSEIVLALTQSTTATGFIDVQAKGASFQQQSSLTTGLPAGCSITALTYKRQVIGLGPGGYMSARYGE